jgi:hypothetical protein
MPIINGRETQVLLQRNTGAYRAVPTPVGAFKMKISELDFGRDPQREEDPTVATADPLAEKMDEGNAIVAGSGSAILCLNDIGQWLSLLWGAPVTTGLGPYTHTWTMDLTTPPDALLELGYTNAAKFEQWLGVILNKISWNVIEGNQSISLDLIGAVQTSPAPVAAFDAAPTAYAKNRACAKGGKVYDVDGASTLGQITTASVDIGNDVEGQLVADGLEGYGAVLLGQRTIGGSLTALFDSGTTIFDHGQAHTSKPITLISQNKAGDNSLTLNVPNAEFDEPKHKINTSKGLVVEAGWRAHAGGAAPTLVLVNDIASY